MNFSGRTPESLSPRSDSKNPATTCKGITANGRPCRRALAATPDSSPGPSPNGQNGVLAVLEASNAAAFYCWQHKDQAETLASRSQQKATLYPLKERSSIDTLAERVGVLDLNEEVQRPKRARHWRRHGDEKHLTRRDTLPSGWHDVSSPLMTVPEELVRPKPAQTANHRPGRSDTKFSWSCCLQHEDDDGPPPRVHHNQRPYSGYTSPPPMQVAPTQAKASTASPGFRRKPIPPREPMSQRPPPRLQNPSPTLSRPSTQPSSNSTSQTQALLSLIPGNLPPQTTSLLLTELSRPISPHDETGYIYIFWLTPESTNSKPDADTASSILDDDNQSPSRASSTSSALHQHSSIKRPTAPRTILLKIGRAQNVHRRLSQWTKQCGQNITLVRFYPHDSNTSTSNLDRTSPVAVPTARKVPFVSRVERLIHLELGAKRVKQERCEECGREHREWFEVEATRQGLRGVDGVVRRWVRWAEEQARGAQPDRAVAEETRGARGEQVKSFGDDGPGVGRQQGAEVNRVRREIRERERANHLGGYY